MAATSIYSNAYKNICNVDAGAIGGFSGTRLAAITYATGLLLLPRIKKLHLFSKSQ